MVRQDSTPARQRLAAILAADAAGYSRLMAADERGTIAALDGARAVFREQIESHQGRVVDMAGDSVLAVFETASGAVGAALAVQQRLDALAVAVPAEQRLRFRIGVHLGDVMEKADGTVYGDGVNIAARLEGLALPGGVTVSDAVHAAVRSRVAVRFEDLGAQQVKNITDPVRAYRVLARANSGAPAPGRGWLVSLTSPVFARRGLIVAGFIATSVVLGAAVWRLREAARGGGVAPITMSVAIGPISAPPNDVAAAQAAAALAQGLAGGISAFHRHVRVVSVAAGTPTRGHEAARDAGARYLVEGELNGVAPQRTLSLRLLETERGTQVWSGRSDLPDAAVGQPAPAAVRKVIERVAYAVGDAEVRRVLPKPVGQLDAMERVVRAYGLLSQGQSLQIAIEARGLLEEAQRLEPTLLPVLWMMSWPLGMQFDLDPYADRERYILEMDRFTMRAVTLDPDNWIGWAERADALMLLGRWNASLEASERVIRMDPHSARPYNNRAALLIHVGRPAEALPLTAKAAELDGSYSGATLLLACEAHLLLGATDQAIGHCERASGLDPNDFMPHAFLTAAYANAGSLPQARNALRAVLKTAPGHTIAQLRSKRPSDHPEYLRLAEQHWYDGLRRAGMTEQ